MANLSNINNKFLFTDGDFLKIGNLAPINNISGTESGISITNSNVASITLDNTAASGKRYVMYSSGNGSLVFWDGDAASARLQIDTSGNSTFAGDVKIYKANAFLELGENGSGGNFGFIGWDDASNYLFIGNSYSSAYNKNIVISNTGNVGIGTNSPVAAFQVGSITTTAMSQVVGKARIVGTNYIPSSTQMGTLDIASTTRNSSAPFNQGFGPSLTFSQSISGYVNGYEVVIGAIKSIVTSGSNTGQESAMTFLVNGGTSTGVVERMRIAEDGNVGIGVVNPETSRLLVRGSTNDSTSQIFQAANFGGASKYVIRADGDNKWYKSDNSLSMVLNQLGNVGIGTTGPLSKLELGPNGSLGANITNENVILNLDGGYGTTGVTGQYKVMGFVGTTRSVTDITAQTSGEVLKNFYVGIIGDNYFNNNRFSIWQAGVERLTILGTATGSGNVGIGVTSPTSGNLVLPQEESGQFKIAFTGASSSSGISTVDQSGSGLYIGANSRVNNSGVVVYHNSAYPSSGIYFDGWAGDDMEFYTGAAGTPTVRMRINSTGVVSIGTTNSGSKLNVGGTIAAATNDLSNGMIVPRSLGFSHPGNTGTFTRTFNPVTLFGMGFRGGQVLFECTGWQMAMNNGYIMWRNAGGSDPIGTNGTVQYVQTAYVSGGQGSNTIAVSTNSGTNDITITFTGWHGNSHGFMCRITTNYM